jgi:ribosomal protein S12 methylthiotransferase accessory factor
MDMEVYFPGGKKVYARYKGFTVETDQPVDDGGDNSAPSPFDLFMLSIGTCAGYYVLTFLQQRRLSTEGAGILLRRDVDPTLTCQARSIWISSSRPISRRSTVTP